MHWLPGAGGRALGHAGARAISVPLRGTLANPMTAPAEPADVESLDAIVSALYAAVSFPAGGKPDWERFRSLFSAHALMIRVDPHVTAKPAHQREGEAIRTTPVEHYIERTQSLIDGGSLSAFIERELVRRTEVFGDVAQVFSSYERSADGGDPRRGINSMQLVKDGTRWWITSVAWTDETNEMPLPSRYLPRP